MCSSFSEVAIPKTDSDDQFVIQKYLDTYGDLEVLKSVPHFVHHVHQVHHVHAQCNAL